MGTILNALSIVTGSRQNSPGPINEGGRRHGGWEKKDDHSKSWYKSRGHKKHCKH